MRRLSFILAMISLTTANGPTATNRNRGYVFTAPKRLIAGETENVCLSFHHLEAPVHISVDLLSSSSLPSSVTPTTNPEDDILGSIKTTLKSGIETCLELRVASSTKYRVGILKLRLEFDKHPDYIVDAEKKVFIEYDALVTFVETDKAIYKPGQDVNIRVLTLKHNLKPWIKPISKVWIENPSEVRVAQWTNVSTENGMAQLSFPLSSEPISGVWRIKVEKMRSQLIHTSTFEVKKYVLPRFQVTISAPNYIVADAKNATWKVCVRYSYGEPVKGILLLSLRPQTSIWKRKQTIAEIKYEEKFDATTDGCMNYTVNAQVLGLPHWKVAPNNIILLVNFTEAKSGVVETASSRTLVVHQPLKLEFAPHTPKHFKPGLPYHGKLRALHPDASNPAPNEKIQLCLRIRRKDEWQRSVVECRNFTSNIDGYLDFIVPPQHKNIVLLSFVATAVDYPTKYYSPDKRWRVFLDQPSAYIDVEPWYSPSSSYLSVTRTHQPIVCGEKYSFNVMYTNGNMNSEYDADPITFHYSINSKGDLLVFGHIKYKPRKNSVLDYSEFRNLLGATNQSNVGSMNPIVHRFPLSVKITASMAPVSELLLYYVRGDGEVVTASQGIQVGQCFENKARMTWYKDSQSPGSVARLHLEAAPRSLCGLSAVDKSTKFLGSGQATLPESNRLDPESTFARLVPFHLPPEALPVQSAWTHCDKFQSPEEGIERVEGPEEEIDHLPGPEASAMRTKRHSVTYNACANYVDAIQAFDDFGAIVMSDLTLESRPCPPWRSSFGRLSLSPISQEDMDEPDRMLKAVKAMPLAFQFTAPGGAVAESSAIGQDVGYVDPAALELQTANVVRSYFPETWIWELVSTGESGRANLERQLPDAVTEWVAGAVCLSIEHGLGIAAPVKLTAFQPFFLDFGLPLSIKRGEQLHLKVLIFSYVDHSLPVLLRLRAPEGLELGRDRSPEIRLCLGPKDSAVHEYPLLPRRLGQLNISVIAELDPDAEDCGPKTLFYTRDEVLKSVLVKAEGYPVEVSRSAFLCPMDFGEDSSLVWELELPSADSDEEQLVEGSAKAHLSLIGDVLGPAIDNLDQLVRLPMGCGEQNMILFVPNIHAIAYLDAVNRHTASEMRTRALRNMQKGYERELNYRHPDGSYSAFGAADESGSGGSMWLTAFVVKSFAQARSIIQIDERDLKLSVKWIVRRQLENGCFPVIGQVFHKDMKGGLREEDGSSSALTAYVLVALLESGVPLSAALVNNALYCLEKASASDQLADSPYAGALTTYALALLEHPRANESLRSLLNRATRLNDAIWWEDRSRPNSLALSIETTAYAVLSLVKLGSEANIMEALRAVRWMSKKRNAQGGFSSTQDTVLGLEALAKYALAVVNATATNLFVLVTATDVDRVLNIGEDNRTLLSQFELPSLPTTLELFAGGVGCLLVQSSLRYNKAKASGSEAFDLLVSSESISMQDLETLDDTCSVQRLNICARYKLADEESNMAVLEVGMISGFVPDRISLHNLLYEPSTGVKRFEENGDTVAIYFDKLTTQKTCISFQANRENIVDNTEPGYIKLYDYYQQELTVSTSYTFTNVCDYKNKKHEINGDINNILTKKMQQQTNRQLNDRIASDEIPRQIENVAGEIKVDPSIFKQISINSTVEPTTVDYTEESSGESEVKLILPDSILPSFDVLESTFVNVDHELDTPNGIEGPIPTYIDPPSPTTAINHESLPDITSHFNNFSTTEDLPNEAKSESRCPRCNEELPFDIKELFCSSASAVKAVIRQSRKARLILDLSSFNEARRLRSTIELNIRPECSCTLLDKPGIMVLLLSSDRNRNFSKTFHKTKTYLDNSNSLFTLEPVVGTPREIKEARLSCPITLKTRFTRQASRWHSIVQRIGDCF